MKTLTSAERFAQVLDCRHIEDGDRLDAETKLIKAKKALTSFGYLLTVSAAIAWQTGVTSEAATGSLNLSDSHAEALAESKSTPRSVAVTGHWSLPFDGRLKNDTPANTSNNGEQHHHTPHVTVIHLDQNQIPSAVTLTPLPSGKTNAAMTAEKSVHAAPIMTSSDVDISRDTNTSAQNLSETPSQDSSSPASKQNLPMRFEKEDQVLRLRPPIGERSFESLAGKKTI